MFFGDVRPQVIADPQFDESDFKLLLSKEEGFVSIHRNEELKWSDSANLETFYQPTSSLNFISFLFANLTNPRFNLFDSLVIWQLSLEPFFSQAKGIGKTSEILLKVKLARQFGNMLFKVSEGEVFSRGENLIQGLPLLVELDHDFLNEAQSTELNIKPMLDNQSL